MARRSDSPAARGLSRSQAAEILGMTDREVAKLDGRQLHPTRAADRVWRYDPAEVRALLLNAAPGAPGASMRAAADGDVTAAVFALFEVAKTLPQVAITTKQTAATIIQLRAEYDAMNGSLVLLPDTVRELRLLTGTDARTGPEVVAAVRRALDARFEEGRADAHDFGEVLDPSTGELRKVPPRTRVEPKKGDGDEPEDGGGGDHVEGE